MPCAAEGGRAMYDHKLYLRTLSEFTRVLLTPYDIHAALVELADRVTHVLDLRGSGVSLAQGGRLEFDTGNKVDIAALEQVQQDTQSGPCVDAFHTGAPVVVADLTAETRRWPRYCQVAQQLGISAVASIPMRLDGQAVGAFNLYARGVRVWEPQDVAAAIVMADMATAYLINASHHHQQEQLAEQLQQALDARLLIEQAKGMLAARHQISPDQAFERLRHHARDRRAKVHAVAQAIVELGLDI
jgi:GAF domain-containing protein